MPKSKSRLLLLGAAAMTLATQPLSPAQAYEVERPLPAKCAAMYWIFAGKNHDDPQYLAMHKYARDRDGYTRSVRVSSGFTSWEPLSDTEAFAEDHEGAIRIANDPAYQDSEGLTFKFLNEMTACSIGYLIRVPAEAITDLYQDGDFERLWAENSPRQRQKLEAEDARERANAQANASSAARNKAYGQANSALNSCMSMPSSVDMANPNYPRYTQMKWQCEDIRREAIRIAQASGDNATAMSYINMRFPWQ